MTNSTFPFKYFKLILGFAIVALFVLAGILWRSTPELFDYFNMAFCAH